MSVGEYQKRYAILNIHVTTILRIPSKQLGSIIHNAKTPCAIKGDKCYDCDSPGRICRITTIIDRAPSSMKSEIVFVDEELGL